METSLKWNSTLYLYYDKRRDIRCIIAWAQGKFRGQSTVLCIAPSKYPTHNGSSMQWSAVQFVALQWTAVKLIKVQCIADFSLITGSCGLCSPYERRRTLYTVLCALYTVHCTLYTVHFKVYLIARDSQKYESAGHTVQPQHYRQLKIHWWTSSGSLTLMPKKRTLTFHIFDTLHSPAWPCNKFKLNTVHCSIECCSLIVQEVFTFEEVRDY